MKRFFAIIIFLLIAYIGFEIWSKSGRLTGKKFVAKYKNENFQVFKNRGFVVRGYNRGNPAIILSDFQGKNNCFNMVFVNADSNKITSVKSLPDSLCATPLSKEDSLLTLKFASYGFSSLSVDSAGNIRVWIAQHTECPHLIKFKDLCYKTKEFEHWNNIGDGWYEENL